MFNAKSTEILMFITFIKQFQHYEQQKIKKPEKPNMNEFFVYTFLKDPDIEYLFLKIIIFEKLSVQTLHTDVQEINYNLCIYTFIYIYIHIYMHYV